MKNAFQILLPALALCLAACYSKPYYDRNGKKFRNFNEAAEEWHIEASKVATHGFEMNAYLEAKTLSEKQTQFVLPQDVHKILQHTGQLLVILYNPECGTAAHSMRLAKYAEEHSIPFILLSTRYSTHYIDRKINLVALKNRNRYIIPSGHYFSHILVRKQGQFWAQLAPELHRTYRDELNNASYMILKQDAAPVANIDQGYLNFEQAKEWVNKHF